MSAGLSAGSLIIQPTKSGASVWDAFTLTSSSAAVDATSQAPDTDTFVNTNALGVQVVADASYAPATLELDVILWLLIDYAGT